MKRIHIEGAEAIAMMLKELPIKLQKNVMRTALNAGSAVYKRDMQLNVPVDDGDLKGTIRVSSRINKDTVESYAKVGGKGTKAFYAHMVEYGTNAHVINAKTPKGLKFKYNGMWVNTMQVLHTGAIAKPFVRPAFDNKSDEATQAVAGKIRERLSEQFKK